MFKICLIGCGFMSLKGHGPACRKYAALHADTELSACCDVDAEKAEAFRREFGFQRSYTDYMEMIQKEKPDVALVITPVNLTAQISKAIMSTKTNILLEKPPGMNAEETKSIHACAEQNGVYARVAFNRRYTPLLSALMQEIKACQKPILHIDCNFLRSGRADDDFCTTAIHGIDTVSYLAGSRYESAEFLYQSMHYQGKEITNYYVHAKMENGVYANLNFMPCVGCHSERIHVSCEEYTFFADLPIWHGIDLPGRLVCTNQRSVYKDIAGAYDTIFEGNGFYDENAGFFDLIKQNCGCFSDVETGIQSVEIAACMREKKPFYRK